MAASDTQKFFKLQLVELNLMKSLISYLSGLDKNVHAGRLQYYADSEIGVSFRFQEQIKQD